jgi:predicted phosphodiesterase
MRLALISDIHGNAVALDAVLADAAARGVDAYACLGDTILSGPQPREALARVRALGCPVVRGNCDDLAVRLWGEPTPPPNATPSHFAPWVAEIDFWSAHQLTAEEAAYLAALPLTATIPLADGAALTIFHAAPDSNVRVLPPEIGDAALAEALGPADGAVLAGGHTHKPMVRSLPGRTFINPGSVGLPLARDPVTGGLHNPSDYAEYALLIWEDGALTVDPRRVAVDASAVEAAARSSGMPHADRWRTDWTKA